MRSAHLPSARFQGLGRSDAGATSPAAAGLSLRRVLGRALRWVDGAFGVQRALVGWAGPWEARAVAGRTARLVAAATPDLVHALRIPMEGESLVRVRGVPTVLSVWGNDLTLWAAEYRGHRRLTRTVLRRACGLHADCARDVRLGRALGFPDSAPTLVAPSGGGIKVAAPLPVARAEAWRARLGIAPTAPVVLNPRGLRVYVCTREYVEAIPRILAASPSAVFVSVGAAGAPAVEALVARHRVRDRIRLLPIVSQEELAELFRLATVMVSPSLHDGTPNTLLEGMAQGAFPVAGDIESIREWIEHGRNGLLCDPRDSEAIAAAVVRALSDPALRASAAEINARLVRERADYDACMGRVGRFYEAVVLRYQATDNPGGQRA